MSMCVKYEGCSKGSTASARAVESPPEDIQVVQAIVSAVFVPVVDLPESVPESLRQAPQVNLEGLYLPSQVVRGARKR